MRDKRIKQLIATLSPHHQPIIQVRPVIARQQYDEPIVEQLTQPKSDDNNSDSSPHNESDFYTQESIIEPIDEAVPYEFTSFASDNIEYGIDEAVVNDDDDDDSTPIFEGSSINYGLAMTALLKLVITANLSNSGITCLLSTLQFLLTDINNCLPKSLYKFQQYYKDVDSMRKVYYCSEHRTLSSGACGCCGVKSEYICWNGISSALKKRLKGKVFYENVGIIGGYCHVQANIPLVSVL